MDTVSAISRHRLRRCFSRGRLWVTPSPFESFTTPPSVLGSLHPDAPLRLVGDAGSGERMSDEREV